MPSPSSQPTDSITLSPVEVAEIATKHPELFGIITAMKQKTSDAQIPQPTEAIPALVCPPDISQKDAAEFAKLGLSYETRADGVWLAVYEDPETHQKTKFIYNPQVFVNANPPTNTTWKKDGMIEHEVNLDGLKSVWHFNRSGANSYAQQLSDKNVKLADRNLAQIIASKFGGQIYKAFGIPLTAWSHPNGDLNRDGVGRYADLWLGNRYLGVNRDGACVFGGNGRHGLGLFLQDT